MTERGRQAFDREAVAKALGTKPQEVNDPAYGAGQHFQIQTDKAFLSLDAFPESGVSRITTRGARIELFGGILPQVEDEGIVFIQKDADHEHSTVSLHPDGALTLGYQVDAGPVAVDGLPNDIEDTEAIITRSEAVTAPAEEPKAEAPAVSGPKPPEKPTRMSGAFPDERPMIHRVGDPAAAGPSVNATVEPALATTAEDDPLATARRVRAQEQPQPEAAAEDEPERVKLTGRIGRTPTFRTTANGKFVGKFSLAVHLDDGQTQWHDVLAFGTRATTLQQRVDAGQLAKGHEVDVVGYPHTREYKGRDGTPKTAQEIYLAAIARR
ncbi:single-strand binding protein/Primosomal replication protein n [Actinobacteria bacterium OV450]|nr:single-strand binding protein/Primosomal replication protein n [Actinobacteria bacterium OV450]